MLFGIFFLKRGISKIFVWWKGDFKHSKRIFRRGCLSRPAVCIKPSLRWFHARLTLFFSVSKTDQHINISQTITWQSQNGLGCVPPTGKTIVSDFNFPLKYQILHYDFLKLSQNNFISIIWIWTTIIKQNINIVSWLALAFKRKKGKTSNVKN